ncbi:MAG: GDSL-type esterase/lipase family protein, partial [Bacilli bacterium]|nr:GDSL-type esterase/lipase family protein [Bacilli bacterium]
VVAALIMLAVISTSVVAGTNLLKDVNKHIPTSTTKTNVVVKEKEEEIDDYKRENIVFYGDSITEMYEVEKYFPNYPVVNAGHGGYLSRRLLEEVDEKLLIYNPTKVFMLMGTNDIAYSNYTNEEIVNNVKEIVNIIRKDRKNVKIYIESIYPVNEDINIDKNVMHIRENKRIREINKMLKDYCKEANLTYVNLFDVLKEENGTIDEDYTLEGLHINENGYKVITEYLMKYVKEA